MDIKNNLINLMRKIEKAANKVNRDPADIKLVAVTKTHPPEVLDQALRIGIQVIGENKIQEVEYKLPLLKEKFKEFHFIGHLQSNKIKKLLKFNPDLIHSIDKISTAKKLDQFLEDTGRIQDILIQINTSKEISKNGINPNEIQDFLDKITNLKNIRILGLMTIGKYTTNEDEIRNCFKMLKEIFEDIKKLDYNNVEMKYLSMGMSGDYEIAIEEGANLIRVGSAIFGARDYSYLQNS